MTPRWDKAEAGETMAPVVMVVASVEVDMVAVDVVTEVVAVEATATTVEVTGVDVDTVEVVGEDMETTVVVEEVVGVVMVDIVVETTGVMTEAWAEAGEIQALAVVWTAIVVAESSTIHSPLTRECVVAILAKQTLPLQLQPTWKNPTPTGQTSIRTNNSKVALLSTKLAIQATMRIRATTALFMLAI